MGRKARATKTELKKQTSATKSPPYLQTTAVKEDIVKASSENPAVTPHSLSENLMSAVAKTRRSQRIKNTSHSHEIDHVIQEIDMSESEKEDQPPPDENKSPEYSSDKEKDTEKKEDRAADVKYKCMYISSQKKIEALLEENRVLKKNLEHALGKVNLFEKQSDLCSEVMTVIASLCKVNENLSAQLKKRTVSHTTEVEGISKKKKGVQ